MYVNDSLSSMSKALCKCESLKWNLLRNVMENLNKQIKRRAVRLIKLRYVLVTVNIEPQNDCY